METIVPGPSEVRRLDAERGVGGQLTGIRDEPELRDHVGARVISLWLRTLSLRRAMCGTKADLLDGSVCMACAPVAVACQATGSRYRRAVRRDSMHPCEPALIISGQQDTCRCGPVPETSARATALIPSSVSPPLLRWISWRSPALRWPTYNTRRSGLIASTDGLRGEGISARGASRTVSASIVKAAILSSPCRQTCRRVRHWLSSLRPLSRTFCRMLRPFPHQRNRPAL